MKNDITRFVVFFTVFGVAWTMSYYLDSNLGTVWLLAMIYEQYNEYLRKFSNGKDD